MTHFPWAVYKIELWLFNWLNDVILGPQHTAKSEKSLSFLTETLVSTVNQNACNFHWKQLNNRISQELFKLFKLTSC